MVRSTSLCFLIGLTLGSNLALCCQPSQIEEFRAYLQSKKVRRIVFFASWCVACKDRLKTLGEGDVLVSAFDETERARRVLRDLGTQAPCFYGEEIVKHYKIKKLPAEVVL